MNDIRQAVREAYGKIAEAGSSDTGCCGPSTCCGGAEPSVNEISQDAGYSKSDASGVPDGADLGLGSGKPVALADLKPGETVLDLGSGGGVDCFLAARSVGEEGTVIGVDMTPEMVALARKNAVKAGVTTVDFRLGEIEHLPVGDESVDAIISNCVINLSPEKATVFREAYRVLKPGGRLAVSDVVATREMPDEVRGDLAQHAACVAGAVTVPELETLLAEAGFQEVQIRLSEEAGKESCGSGPGAGAESLVVPATIEAIRS
jgi:SAM-dependent methyltransferase